ncbi:cytochrome P450 [Xylariales sp. PMI_506]|nr:cytochrome P450 [Xylariales sp. PMI_506]
MSIIFTVCLSLLVGLLAILRSNSPKHKKWIRVGHSPGLLGLNSKIAKEDFQRKGRALIREGYQKNRGQNFIIQTSRGAQLVIAPEYLPEIRMLPESQLSHAQVLMDYWVGEHIGAELAMTGHQHIDAVRGPLTKSLKTIVPATHREYRRTSEALFSQLLRETNQMNAHTFCYATVQGITSMVLMGEELAHSGGWDKIVMEYFPEAMRIRNALKPWPRSLRPMVKPFLVPNNQLETIITKAETFLEEPIRQRRQPDNQDVDILKFLAEYNESPRKVAMQIVGIITGALNTSTHAIMQVIFDLCTYPAYIPDIRAEAIEALASEDGQWTLRVCNKLHLLDSFLKESLRLFAPEGLAITRVATSSFSLSDGTWIPRGTHIAVAGEAMARDPNFYKDPDTFNGRRFLDASGRPISPDREFSGIEPGNGMWGSGRLTCPGRHYASVLSKVIIANLLLKYDISFPEGQKKAPPGTENDANILPDMNQNIVFSERK